MLFIAIIHFYKWLHLRFSGKKDRYSKSEAVDFKENAQTINPLYFFGTLYYFLIGSGDNYSVDGFVQQLLHGKSHLWFLLMLFWCFIIHWIIISLTPQKCSKKMYLVILLPLFFYFVSPVVTDFLCLKQAFMYYAFFYVGFLSYDMFKPNIRVTLALTTSYIFLFLIFYYYVDHRATIGMYPLYKIIELSTKLGGVFCFMSLATYLFKPETDCQNNTLLWYPCPLVFISTISLSYN